MVKIVVDTSVLIERIRQGFGMYDGLVDKTSKSELKLISPVVVLTELWAGKKLNDKQSLKDVEELIKPIEFMDIDGDLAKKAGEMTRNYGLFGFDAIIAATTLMYEAQLATLNKKHFEKVRGLKLYT